MKKSTMSILLAAMMAVSGFASAQTADVKSGTQGGSGPAPAVGMSNTTRAEVKSEISPNANKSGIQGGSAASPDANANTKNVGSKMTAAERKAKRDERRAARKAKREERAASAAAKAPQKSGSSAN